MDAPTLKAKDRFALRAWGESVGGCVGENKVQPGSVLAGRQLFASHGGAAQG